MSETDPLTELPKDTVPCVLCKRKFLPERLEKHQKICSKTKESQKKRKAFDSHKQRADLEEVNGFPISPPSRQTTATIEKKSTNKTQNWRAKHEEFLRTVRQARGEKVEEPANGGNTVPVGYIVCTFCGRNFSEKAADRHIEWCKEQKARIPRSATNAKALERMKARTKYKPTPKKSSPKTETPPQMETPPQTSSRSQPPTPPVNRKKVSPTTETPSKTTSRSQPPTPAAKRKTTSVKTPPNSLPNGLKSKTSPKLHPKTQRSPTQPPKSDKQRINSLSRPKNMSPDSVDHLIKQTEPIMKFKEKFPNYRVDTNFTRNEHMRELLKKTEAYNGGPRTVPGVRTGGMSPVKTESNGFSHQNGHYNNNNNKHISEEEELEKLKTRIEEMYLNGNTKYKPNSLQNNTNNTNNYRTISDDKNNKNQFELNSEGTTRGSTSGSSVDSSSIHTPPRDGSGSDGARSQASSTNSTGLPKFCHQCGTKYPSTIAKYCYECGSRRLGTVGPFIST